MSFKLRDPIEVIQPLDAAIKALQKSPTNGNLTWALDRLDAASAYCERLYEHCGKQREELAMWHQRYEEEKSMEKKGITDELRECMRTATRFYEDMRSPYNDRERLSIAEDELTAIADRIDDQHDAELQAEYINGYHKALEEVKDGYIKLPVDADGVPIHLGDELEDGTNLPAKVGALLLDSGGWWCKGVKGSACVTPSTLRHVQPDSWERIINDAMFVAQGHLGDKDACVDLVERCRRLAGDQEG